MRLALRTFLTGIILSATVLTAAAQKNDVRFIDLDRAFNEFYKTKLADAQLKDQADAFNESRKKLLREREAISEEFKNYREEAGNTALTDAARDQLKIKAEEKLIELRDKEGDIRTFDDSRRKQLEEQGRRMRKRIVAEIREELEKYSKNEGFGGVIDTSGQSLNGVSIVLYTDPRLDITDNILAILDQGQEEE